MKIVIDIDKNDYDIAKREKIFDQIYETVANGIPYEERPTGHWINRCRGSSFCSVCGGEEPTEDIEFMNYCPNCGADMRRETENDNE